MELQKLSALTAMTTSLRSVTYATMMDASLAQLPRLRTEEILSLFEGKYSEVVWKGALTTGAVVAAGRAGDGATFLQTSVRRPTA